MMRTPFGADMELTVTETGEAPLLVPSVRAAGYDPNNNHVRIHLHFDSLSTTTFAGFAVNTSAPDGCGGQRFWVRPDGT